MEKSNTTPEQLPPETGSASALQVSQGWRFCGWMFPGEARLVSLLLAATQRGASRFRRGAGRVQFLDDGLSPFDEVGSCRSTEALAAIMTAGQEILTAELEKE